MEKKFIEMLIRDCDQLLKLPEEAYYLVVPSLKEVNLKRGTVIKDQASVDKVSRYLCKGFIGSYRNEGQGLELISIYQAIDTVFDESSFRSGKPSDIILKSISEVVFLELSGEAEGNLLNGHPRLTLLAHKMALRITERSRRVHAISKMGIEKGYETLMKEFPGLEAEVSNHDLGSFFGIHTRSVERWKHSQKDRNHD